MAADLETNKQSTLVEHTDHKVKAPIRNCDEEGREAFAVGCIDIAAMLKKGNDGLNSVLDLSVLRNIV